MSKIRSVNDFPNYDKIFREGKSSTRKSRGRKCGILRNKKGGTMGKRKSEKVILGKIGEIILEIAKKYFNKSCIVGHNEYCPMEDDCSEAESKILEVVKGCIPERFFRTYGFEYRVISNEITDEIEQNLSKL